MVDAVPKALSGAEKTAVLSAASCNSITSNPAALPAKR